MSPLLDPILIDATQKLNIKIDNLFLEGLSRKGFIFDSINELKYYLERNPRKIYCTEIESYFDIQTTYWYESTPFLLHKRNKFYDLSIKHDSHYSSFHISAGEFAYL